MLNKMIFALTASTVLTAGAASAFPAMTGAETALRAGPSEAHAQIATVAPASEVEVSGCLAALDWCKVEYGNQEGWIPAGAVGVEIGGDVVMLSEHPATVSVETVTYTDTTGSEIAAATGAVGVGAAAGAAAGPVGAVVGAMIGGIIGGEAVEPDTKVVTYVQEHPVGTVYVEGDIVPGAIVPDAVVLTPVPDSDYAYVVLNDQPVIVTAKDRQVIYLVK